MLNAFRGVFLVGCLVAAYFLVEQPEAVRWPFFGAAVVVALAGIAGMRSQRVKVAGGPARALHEEPVGQAVVHISSWVERQLAERPTDLSGRIDAEVKPHLRAVEHGLAELQARRGVKAYASFMDDYARAERALNRAWSAAADGFHAEAHAQLAIAEQSLRRARDRLSLT